MTTLIEECKQICCPTPLNRANVPSMVRLRLTFYNSSLFMNSELVPEEKQAATVAVEVWMRPWLSVTGTR